MNHNPPHQYECELIELLAEANNLLPGMAWKNTTLAGVYLDAAAIIYYGLRTYSCTAVEDASEETTFWLTAQKEYENLFAHRDRWEKGTAFWLDGKLGSNKARKEWRETALCMMAAIATDEDGTT